MQAMLEWVIVDTKEEEDPRGKGATTTDDDGSDWSQQQDDNWALPLLFCPFLALVNKGGES
jgi:hypothetical protein